MDSLPNGLPGLVFSFGEHFRYEIAGRPGSSKEISCGNIIGIHNCTYTGKWKDSLKAFVIIFKPLGLFHLLKQNMHELKNDLTGLNLVGITEAAWIGEKLRLLPAHEQQIAFAEEWLEKRFSQKKLDYTITEYITEQIIERKGMVSIQGISGEMNINKKYIERNFNYQLGLSPKEFAEIIRFNYLNTLMHREAASWKDLVYLGNFYDQSHLIKHFQRITGLSPQAYKKIAGLQAGAQFLSRHNLFELISATETSGLFLNLGNPASGESANV
ncbi:AraC family transcriptional regulator [Anseongella ginsenosidimutans]|nr:AraC family transcriptional regulator [Anseongella ginsenosidimutans]QEC51094.1 AraC family transcriptional regulator [Anseongella ginsenosidimutans]